jgi:hypothetical protein
VKGSKQVRHLSRPMFKMSWGSGMVVHTCSLTYTGGKGTRIVVWGQPLGKSVWPQLSTN